MLVIVLVVVGGEESNTAASWDIFIVVGSMLLPLSGRCSYHCNSPQRGRNIVKAFDMAVSRDVSPIADVAATLLAFPAHVLARKRALE